MKQNNTQINSTYAHKQSQFVYFYGNVLDKHYDDLQNTKKRKWLQRQIEYLSFNLAKSNLIILELIEVIASADQHYQ